MESNAPLELNATSGASRSSTAQVLNRLAHFVSAIFSPPVLSVVSLLLLAGVINSWAAWLWAIIQITLLVLVPCAYISWLVRHGQVTDFDLQVRAQRTRPYAVTLACLALASLLSVGANAPHLLVILTTALLIQMALLMTITLAWKISLHTAAAASVVTLLWLLFGPTVGPLALLVPLVGWSRVRLRRHTPWQVIAGACLSVGVMVSVFTLFN